MQKMGRQVNNSPRNKNNTSIDISKKSDKSVNPMTCSPEKVLGRPLRLVTVPNQSKRRSKVVADQDCDKIVKNENKIINSSIKSPTISNGDAELSDYEDETSYLKEEFDRLPQSEDENSMKYESDRETDWELDASEHEEDEDSEDQMDPDSMDMPLLTGMHQSPIKAGRKKGLTYLEASDEDQPAAKKRRVNLKRKRPSGRKRKPFRPQRLSESEEEPEEEAEEALVPKKFSVTGNWYIAAGYLNDVIELLESFERCSGWSFEAFSKCWRDAKFSLVYRGRQTFKELLEFSEEICLLTKRFLQRPHSYKKRIGALYTLYGLYFKHPLRCFFSIRMQLEEYENTLELVRPFFNNPANPDPAFIFRKLEVEGAFRHCVTTTELCFDLHNNERDDVDLAYGREKLVKSSAINEALPAAHLEAASMLHKAYAQSKQHIIDEVNVSGKSLSMVNPDFVDDIIDDLSRVQKKTLEELHLSEPFLSKTGEERDEGEVGLSKLETLANPAAVSEDMLHTINNSRLAGRVKGREVELQLLNDGAIEFMTSYKSKRKFLMKQKRADKNKPGKHELNLKDLEARTNLYHDKIPGLVSQKKPTKQRKSRSRKDIIVEALSAPKGRKPATYEPCGDKTLDDMEVLTIPFYDNDEPAKDEIIVQSATKVAAVPNKQPELLELAVTVSYDGVRKTRNIKVCVSPMQWLQMREDPIRIAKFKIRIRPLFEPTDPDISEWIIEDVEAVPVAEAPPVSASSIVLNSAYFREQRAKSDPESSRDTPTGSDRNDLDYEAEDDPSELESDRLPDDLLEDSDKPTSSDDNLVEAHNEWMNKSEGTQKRTNVPRQTTFQQKPHFQRDNPLIDSHEASMIQLDNAAGPNMGNYLTIGGTSVKMSDKSLPSAGTSMLSVAPYLANALTAAHLKTLSAAKPKKTYSRNQTPRHLFAKKTSTNGLRSLHFSPYSRPNHSMEEMEQTSIVPALGTKPVSCSNESPVVIEKAALPVDCKKTVKPKVMPQYPRRSSRSKVAKPLVSPKPKPTPVMSTQIESLQKEWDDVVDEPIASSPNSSDPCPSVALSVTQEDSQLALDALTSSIDSNVLHNPEIYQKVKYTDGRELFVPKSMINPTLLNCSASVLDADEPVDLILPKPSCSQESTALQPQTKTKSPHECSTQEEVPQVADNSSAAPRLAAFNLSVPPSPKKPACAFLFSRKFRTMEKLKFTRGEALGVPPVPVAKVSFFKRGSLGKYSSH